MIGPEIALLVAAFIILLTVSFKRLSAVAPLLAFVGMAVSLVLSIAQWGNQKSGFFGMVSCDNFGVAFKILFLVTSMLALLAAYRYLVVKGINRPEFYALLNISTMGMMVLYVMAGFARRSLESNEAGIKYFIMGAFASAFLLMGIAAVFGASGTTDLRRLMTDFNYVSIHFKPFLYVGVGLILVGFGFKVGAVPFHSWIPDVYQGAPTPVTAFFSVGPKAAFWVLAVLTMTVGNVLALRQNNIKRMLAYSSIAHAGYILVALAVGGRDSVSAAIFYLVAYAMFNLGAFAVITLLETRSGCKSDFDELVGFGKRHPFLASLLTLFSSGWL